MAISSTARQTEVFESDGSQLVFPFSFKVFSPDEIGVQTNSGGAWYEKDSDLVYGTDYSVALNDNQDVSPGGSVTLTSALPKGTKLVIVSQVTPLQEIVISRSGGFYPDQLNNGFDRAIALIQELKLDASRTLKLPATSSESPEDVAIQLMKAQEEAQDYRDQAQDYRDQAQTILTQVQAYGEAAVTIEPYAQYLSTIAGSIDDVNTVGENILTIQTVAGMEYSITTVAGLGSSLGTLAENVDVFEEVSEHSQAIQIVAADFNSSVPCPNVHDFGIYGEDDIPSWTPTGGSISTVAGSINNVNTVAAQDENITFIIEHWSEIATAIAALNGTVLIKTNNLSDLANVATARTNLGLGTMATSNLDLGEWSEN